MVEQKIVDEFLFYAKHIDINSIELDDDEVFHITRVLRINENVQIQVTNGNGLLAKAVVSSISKRKIEIKPIEIIETKKNPFHVHVAICPTKNIARFEWFLEKSCEMGINEITPLLSVNSERKNIRLDRLEKIIISALKQSKRTWKPKLNELTTFDEFIGKHNNTAKYIADLDDNAQFIGKVINNTVDSHLVLIGPEGGFSPNELAKAKEMDYKTVLLSNNRLRTETAGIAACNLLRYHFDEYLNNKVY